MNNISIPGDYSIFPNDCLNYINIEIHVSINAHNASVMILAQSPSNLGNFTLLNFKLVANITVNDLYALIGVISKKLSNDIMI